MFYRDLGTDYSHFNGFLWEINARKTNFSPYKHSLGTNYVREPRYHCILDELIIDCPILVK